MQSQRTPLQRLSPGYFESRWLHLGGYVIAKDRRSWSERGRPRGRHHDPPPRLTWWEVYPALGDPDTHGTKYRKGAHRDHHVGTFDTLREARQWCDGHPRWGLVASDEEQRDG